MQQEGQAPFVADLASRAPAEAPDREREDERRAAMALLARATCAELRNGLDASGCPQVFHPLRPPQTGLVMVQGRMAGEGAAFNLGEATVTRAAVKLPTGEVGFSYALGRDRKKASLAALADAVWQQPSWRDAIGHHILRPVAARLAAESTRSAARAAATKVEFFTLVRGED